MKGKIFTEKDINLAIFILASLLVANIFLGVCKVDGSSMSPTLESGNYKFYFKDNKLSRPLIRYKLGDIVIAYEGNLFLIKRIAGLEGDVITEKGNKIYNGDKLVGFVPPDYWNENLERQFTVPKDSLYILGDNYSDSTDSRYFGCVQKSSLVGKLVKKLPLEVKEI